jgi:hypothetical protein
VGYLREHGVLKQLIDFKTFRKMEEDPLPTEVLEGS